MPKPGDRLVPAVFALILTSAFPPLHLLIPSFVGPCPSRGVDRGQSQGAGGVVSASGEAFRGAAWFGVLYFGLIFHWIASALMSVTLWEMPAYVAVVSALAFLAGGFGWALHRLVRRSGVPLWLALPLAWAALEWLPGACSGRGGAPLAGSRHFADRVSRVGWIRRARGITFWLALLNGLLAEAVLAARLRQGRRRVGAWAVAFAAVLAVPAWWGHR